MKELNIKAYNDFMSNGTNEMLVDTFVACFPINKREAAYVLRVKNFREIMRVIRQIGPYNKSGGPITAYIDRISCISQVGYSMIRLFLTVYRMKTIPLIDMRYRKKRPEVVKQVALTVADIAEAAGMYLDKALMKESVIEVASGVVLEITEALKKKGVIK